MKKNTTKGKFSFAIILGVLLLPATVNAQKKVDVWLTDPKANTLFKQQESLIKNKRFKKGLPVIIVDDKKTFQAIDGFGYTLTGGSAGHVLGMSPDKRETLLQELFSFDKQNIGTSYIRLSIGASDLNETIFSYNDLEEGETDTAMLKFDLGQDRKDVIPVLKQILAINPGIKILGSPWSPPVWMKTNNDTRGGSLKPEYYQAYAKYFVKYIQQMQEEGIVIDAITVQNEPLHPGNNPSLLMLAKDQADFVKNHLGPVFKKEGIKTKIILYDHNADRPDYPISILNDPEAKQYIDGSAFHLYGGKIDALSEVHEAHPDKHLYFTEQWVGAPSNMTVDFQDHIEKLFIGATRNWSRTVLEWNLSSNSALTPFTDRGGCNKCLGAVTIDGDEVKRNPAYYTVAHAAKFVRPGSVRIASDLPKSLPNVAFKTPNGKTVILVLNKSEMSQSFVITQGKKSVVSTLNPGAAGTFIW